MKIYNIRNNEEIGSFNTSQLDFLKEHLLKEGESDDDFFINSDNIKLLKSKATTDDQKEIVKLLKKALKQEERSGMDIYYDEDNE